MPVTSAREKRQLMTTPQEVPLSADLVVELKRPTTLDMAIKRQLPMDAFKVISDKEKEAGFKRFLNDAKATMEKFAAAFVNPRYDPMSEDEDALWPGDLSDGEMQAATRYIDGGWDALESFFREQGDDSEPLHQVQVLKEQALRNLRSGRDIRTERPDAGSVRQLRDSDGTDRGTRADGASAERGGETEESIEEKIKKLNDSRVPADFQSYTHHNS